MQPKTLIVLMLLLTALCLNSWGAEKHTTDTLETVKKNLTDEKAILIDVREKSEWEEGHLKLAQHLALSTLKAESNSEAFKKETKKKISVDKILYIHCRSGSRVQVAAPLLTAMGYEVRALKDGYKSLLKADFEKAN